MYTQKLSQRAFKNGRLFVGHEMDAKALQAAMDPARDVGHVETIFSRVLAHA